MNIVWQKESRYALVTCFNNGRGVVVEKQICPHSVDAGNAHWVNETSRYFREKLRRLGVLLAEPYTFEEVDGKAIQYSPYVGQDLEEILTRGLSVASVLEKLVATMSGVLSQTEREVGIDARVSNFCLGPDGRVFYVDTFPPLVKYDGNFIVHFPNPVNPVIVEQELRRKFDPLGVMRRLRFSILEQDSGISEELILDAVDKVMGTAFGFQVREMFYNLPDHKNLEVALGEITLEDPDGIREVALRVMPPSGEARVHFLTEIFNLSSHFCPIKMTDECRLGRIRDLLAGI